MDNIEKQKISAINKIKNRVITLSEPDWKAKQLKVMESLLKHWEWKAKVIKRTQVTDYNWLKLAKPGTATNWMCGMPELRGEIPFTTKPEYGIIRHLEGFGEAIKEKNKSLALICIRRGYEATVKAIKKEYGNDVIFKGSQLPKILEEVNDGEIPKKNAVAN